MIPTYMHYNFKCSQCFENLLKGLLNELSISIQVSIHFCDSHMKQVLLSILESIKGQNFQSYYSKIHLFLFLSILIDYCLIFVVMCHY